MRFAFLRRFRCLLPCFRRRTRPLPVTLNLLATPFRVLAFPATRAIGGRPYAGIGEMQRKLPSFFTRSLTIRRIREVSHPDDGTQNRTTPSDYLIHSSLGTSYIRAPAMSEDHSSDDAKTESESKTQAPPPSKSADPEQEIVEKLGQARISIGKELRKVIIGQDDVVDQMLIALLSGGHCLITGAPGLAKTLLVSTLAKVFDLSFNRIQFTPDLMPSDITGTEILEESNEGHRELIFNRGPIFANLILADEINRTPPKTQAALLEAMLEKQVSAAGQTMELEKPFFVLATQNPIEMEGTYPLPEAQLDRFMFNVVIDYLSEDEEVAVVSQTTGTGGVAVESIFSGKDLQKCHDVVRRVPIAEEVIRYAVRIASNSRPGQSDTSDYINEWVNWGAGTRAGQSLVLGAKTKALLDGRSHVGYEDIRAMASPVLRHRILTNYRAEAEGITIDQVIEKLIDLTPEHV